MKREKVGEGQGGNAVPWISPPLTLPLFLSDWRYRDAKAGFLFSVGPQVPERFGPHRADGLWKTIRSTSMVRFWSTLVVVAVALAVGSFAHAKDKATKKAKAEDVFKKLDKNDDKKLSEEEFAAFAKNSEKAKAIFQKVDTNRDKSISLEELKEWMKKVEARAKKQAEKSEKPEKK